MWKQWLTAILGLGVVAMPFTGITGDAFTWTLAIGGLAIAALAAWGALEETPGEYTERRYQTQS